MNPRPPITSKVIPAPPTREQIAALAHEIWLERGSPEGSDIDIWLEAERQLTGAPEGKPSAVDPIPANLENPALDSDIAMRPNIDRELDRYGRGGEQRSPTAFGV